MTPDQHPTPADGQPLTRRRLREIERACVGVATPSEPPTITGAQRAVGATLGRKRPRGAVAVILMVVVVLAIVAVPVVLSRSGAGRIL